jgi:hypothetical protein
MTSVYSKKLEGMTVISGGKWFDLKTSLLVFKSLSSSLYLTKKQAWVLFSSASGRKEEIDEEMAVNVIIRNHAYLSKNITLPSHVQEKLDEFIEEGEI